MIPYDQLPAQFREGMRAYIEGHIRPGSFLSAVLARDLYRAMNAADPRAWQAMPEIVAWIWQHVPRKAFGSWKAVNEWAPERSDVDEFLEMAARGAARREANCGA